MALKEAKVMGSQVLRKTNTNGMSFRLLSLPHCLSHLRVNQYKSFTTSLRVTMPRSAETANYQVNPSSTLENLDVDISLDRYTLPRNTLLQ